MRLRKQLTKLVNPGVGRRGFVGTLIGSAILLPPKTGLAAVLTGIAVLDSAAIPVKNASDVILIAIAQAGTRLVAVGEHGVIIYSDDNASSWTQAAVPVDVTLTCLDFATPMLGWAAGHFGIVLNTVDGGKTWQVQLNGIEANQLALAAAQVALSQDATSPGTPLALKRADIFVQEGPDKPFLAILTLSPEHVIVFGAYRMTVMTVDAGKTWSDWSLRVDDKYSHNLYATMKTNTSIYVVGESGLVFRSAEDGDNFQAVTPPSSVTLFGVLGAQDGSILVYGVAGTCFRSSDGGNSWTAVNLDTQDNLTAGVVLPSGRVLIASLSGNVYISHDNGVSFALVSGTPPMSISGITNAGENSLVFAGYSGVTKLSVASFAF